MFSNVVSLRVFLSLIYLFLSVNLFICHENDIADISCSTVSDELVAGVSIEL